ncbi:uncharacterized protein LOC114762864 [Neltuma alba]|uniref:uncharacterized protein LOC114762864 n=1 Tax=Neltuma alba TaxID=207710 RepID=UPI0010A39AD1|nr:uncharacterized protein LOC114762864 [Prosopis alba]
MKKFSILHSVLLFNLMLEFTCMAQHNHTNYCGEIMSQTSSSSSSSSILNNITLCRSHNLYFRTSLGLFKVTSIDYNARTVTISHSSSSSLQFVSPQAVTAGFPSPPESDSLLLFNCSIKRRNKNIISPFLHNCRELYSSKPYECLVVKDVHKIDKGFHPRHLNCSNYMWVHKSSSDVSNYGGYKLGTRISFDIPDHVPDLCKECEKPHGNCGAGLKCLCHTKECKDEILSSDGSISDIGNVFFSLLCIITVLIFVMEI